MTAHKLITPQQSICGEALTITTIKQGASKHYAAVSLATVSLALNDMHANSTRT
jgi:hypothetical protein